MALSRKKHPTRPLHPLVAAFLKGRKEFREAIESPQAGNDGAIASAILEMAGAITGNEKAHDEALKTADSLDLKGCDPNLLILFFHYWLMTSINRNRLAQASVLSDRAKLLIADDTPAELIAMLLLPEAQLAATVGKKEQSLELRRRALEIVPQDSPRYQMFYSDFAILFANFGTFAEIEIEYCRILRSPQHEDIHNTREAIYLIHFVHTGQVGRLREVDRERLKKMPPRDQPAIRDFLALADVLAGRPGENLSSSLAATRELLAGRPEHALQLARESVKTNADFLYGQNFQAFNLVRCELAMRRGEAARRLLRLRRERGNTHYLDDFYLARAELLAGRGDEAGRLFSTAYHACERYHALERLDIELRMACEMSAADSARLMRAALPPHPAGTTPSPAASVAVLVPVPAEPVKTQPSGAARLIGAGLAMVALRETVSRAAKLDMPVLITGETGTGKELVARAIHEEGPRAAEPFVAVNCGALTDSLLESELFGYERGAFTGADKAHQGFFEAAGTGTVLLDEIGEISPRLQVTLLRVLETGEIRRVGSTTSRKVSCRVLAATNAPLERMVGEERFRQDLLYRLRRLEIVVPPLRERAEDILNLAGHFLGEHRTDGALLTMSPELRAALVAYSWPGNVRELRNEMERMRLMNSDQPAYELMHLDPRIAAGAGMAASSDQPTTASTLATQANKTDGRGWATPSAVSIPSADKPGDDELRCGRSPMRRLARLRELFRAHRSMTRAEVAATLGISPNTATKYLQQLTVESFVERVEPNAAPRTHYFRIKALPEATTGF